MTVNDVSCFFLDMDGTFYLGDTVLPGALEFIEKVKKTGRDFLFVTNNSSHDAAFYVERLGRMGLAVTEDKILTSGAAAAAVVLRRFPGKRAFLFGNSFLKRELEGLGVTLTDEDPDYVIAGYDTEITYEKLTKLCAYVREGLPFVATHPDINCPSEHGFLPDLGAMLKLVEASAGRTPDLIVGKPYSGIVEAALLRANVPAEKAAMVGDRLYTDIRTGVDNGIYSILVLSGETMREMAEKSGIRPDLTVGGLGDLIDKMR